MIKAIIFDLDGVLVDARELHYEALNRSLAAFGYTITRDEHLSTYDGLPTRTKLRLLTENKGLSPEVYDDIWKGKQAQTIDIISNEFTYDERMRSILARLRNDGYRIAVCSNSIRESTKMMLLRKGLLEYVEFYLSNEDVRLPKPNPEMYLEAMIRLGLGPASCVIVEDSHHGRQAAFDSGGHLLAVENPDDLTYEKVSSYLSKLQEGDQINHYVPKWQGGKLRVIIPAAGAGEVFKKMGYVFPKPLIDINGKPMIQWVVENINVEAKFIYIMQREHMEKYSLHYLLNLISPGCDIVAVDGPGEGAATSVLQAKHLFDDGDPIVIVNSDQYMVWNSNEFFYAMAADECDGGIVTFNSTHPQWSFVKLNEDGFVQEVAEKKPISDIATAGVYYFRTGHSFVESAEEMIAHDRRVLGQFFICPVYNELIQKNAKIRAFPIDKIWSFSTPRDVEHFIQKFF